MLASSLRRAAPHLHPVARAASRTLSSAYKQATFVEPTLAERLSWQHEDDAAGERRLGAGLYRSLATPRERALSCQALARVYGALEGALDAVAESDKMFFGAGKVWRAHAPGLRRAGALQEAVDAARGGPIFSKETAAELESDERLWSPATRQWVRRVRAAAASDGDLLLGHLYAAHVYHSRLAAKVDYHGHERRLGFASTRASDPGAGAAALAAFGDLTLADAAQAGVVHEAKRSLSLQIALYAEEAPGRYGVWRGAAAGAVRAGVARLTGA